MMIPPGWVHTWGLQGCLAMLTSDTNVYFAIVGCTDVLLDTGYVVDEGGEEVIFYVFQFVAAWWSVRVSDVSSGHEDD